MYNNSLVSNQFNPDSFAVVRKVYEHLHDLKQLERNFNEIRVLTNHTHDLKLLTTNIGSLSKIADNLNQLLSLGNNSKFLSDIAPRVEQFTKEMKDINSNIKSIENMFNHKSSELDSQILNIQNLYHQYECNLSKFVSTVELELTDKVRELLSEAENIHRQVGYLHAEVREDTVKVNRLYEEIKEKTVIIEHLKASDYVELASYDFTEENHKLALEQIELSEELGNDESINRFKLSKLVSGAVI